MPCADDPVLERIESRLVRLGQAIQELTTLEVRLAQIEHRTSGLAVILEGATDSVRAAYAHLYRELSDTVAERDRYRQNGRNKKDATCQM